MELAAAGARVAVNYSSDRERGGASRSVHRRRRWRSHRGRGRCVGAADVARLFKEVDAVFGRLDVLVNNAGIFRSEFPRHHRRELPLPLQHQRAWADSGRCRRRSAVRSRRREHHQSQFIVGSHPVAEPELYVSTKGAIETLTKVFGARTRAAPRSA